MKKSVLKTVVSALVIALLLLPLSAFAYEAVAAASLIPVGRTTGIRLYSEGAVIAGFADSVGACPAEDGGLRVGDVIIAVDGYRVTDGASLSTALTIAEDEKLSVVVMRGSGKYTANVIADYDKTNGRYVLGAMIRDTLAGIGTITYLDPQSGKYGALGHGICDPDTMSPAAFDKGDLMPSSVVSVKKGKDGAPGELVGSYDAVASQGSVSGNTGNGIFGVLSDPAAFSKNAVLETAPLSEVKEGKASIISNVYGKEAEEYEIEIINVYRGRENNRQMLIKVTDQKLLGITGGIVQGMSGSPIIQNGRLVGAVTHVLINDPTKGYGIGVERMLETSEMALAG